MFKFSAIVFKAGNSDSDYIGIACIMKYSVCIVNSSIHCIRVYILIVRFVFGILVCNIFFTIKLNKLIFIALIFNKDRIVLTITATQ